jgi:hypothetical protein
MSTGTDPRLDVLAVLSRDLAEVRAHLAMARDRLAESRAALDECRLRTLIAETPIADRDLHRAAESHARARAEVDRLEDALAELRADHDRLARGRP